MMHHLRPTATWLMKGTSHIEDNVKAAVNHSMKLYEYLEELVQEKTCPFTKHDGARPCSHKKQSGGTDHRESQI